MKTLKTASPIVVSKTTTTKIPPKTTAASTHPMRNDPILQELWDIKAAINKEANYDAATLLRSAESVVTAMRAL